MITAGRWYMQSATFQSVYLKLGVAYNLYLHSFSNAIITDDDCVFVIINNSDSC